MKIELRPWRAEDIAGLTAAVNNKRVQDNLRDGLPFPYTESDAAEYINFTLTADPESTYVFAITVNGKAVGSIGAFRKENIHRRTAEVGYYIAQEYWGRGIGTAALVQMCEYIFAHTDIMRIFAEPFSHNAASRRILEKAGFVLEGIMQKNAVKNGEVLDMCLYALIK